MLKGAGKYKAARYTLGTIGLVGMASIPVIGWAGFIVGGTCALIGLNVQEKEKQDVNAHLYDTKNLYEKSKKREHDLERKLKSIENKTREGGIDYGF